MSSTSLQEDYTLKIRKKQALFSEKKKRNFKIISYMHDIGMSKQANRIYWCGDRVALNEKGQIVGANLCRERFCALCSHLRAEKWRRQTWRVMKYLKQNSEKEIEYIFLTLTYPNCSGKDLPTTLKFLQESYNRLTCNRKYKKICLGSIKALEITVNDKGMFHPHYHVLIAVDKDFYFRSGYIGQKEFQKMWEQACKTEETRICHVEKVTSDIEGAIETVKYTLKDTDVRSKEIFETLYFSIKGKRCITYSGIIQEARKILDLDDVEAKDANLTELDVTFDTIPKVLLEWNYGANRYIEKYL